MNLTKINNSIINIHVQNLESKLSEKKADNYIMKNALKKEREINLKLEDNFEAEEELNESLLSDRNEYSLESQSIKSNENMKKINKNEKEEVLENKLNISDTDNKSKNLEEEDDISDNEGYNNFMREYKQYCKGIKKAINKKVDGEINIQDLLNQANNFYLNNEYSKAKEVLETIISVYPNLQEPYLILSQIYEEEKNDEKSLFFLMLAAQSSGGDKNIWIKCCNYNKKLKNYRYINIYLNYILIMIFYYML